MVLWDGEGFLVSTDKSGVSFPWRVTDSAGRRWMSVDAEGQSNYKSQGVLPLS